MMLGNIRCLNFFYIDRVGICERNFIICGFYLVSYLLVDFWGDCVKGRF